MRLLNLQVIQNPREQPEVRSQNLGYGCRKREGSMRVVSKLRMQLLETHTIHAVWLVLIPMLWFGLGDSVCRYYRERIRSGSRVAPDLLDMWTAYGRYISLFFEVPISLSVRSDRDRCGNSNCYRHARINTERPWSKARCWSRRFLWMEGVAPWLQLAAALYVLVRGLDNIGEGLKRRARALKYWRSVFPEEKKADV